MKTSVSTPDEYIALVQEEQKNALIKLRITIKGNLPEGFSEVMNYGMIGYVVPHTIYPKGYHANPTLPLPFISIASQKSYIAIYHMGLYSDKNLLDWFVKEFSKYSKTKPDIGKSCIRFKNPNQIPFELIALLSKKMTVEDWINIYESVYKKA